MPKIGPTSLKYEEEKKKKILHQISLFFWLFSVNTYFLLKKKNTKHKQKTKSINPYFDSFVSDIDVDVAERHTRRNNVCS